MDPHRLSELRSVAYHRRIAEHLDLQPELLERARERVRSGHAHPHYVAAWTQLLDQPLEVVKARLCADDEEMRALRQASPFAGALSPRERWALFRAVRAEAGG